MNNDELPPAGDIDPGTPVEELARLAEEPSSGFRDLVLGSINRRLLAGQALDVPWWGFSKLFLEYLQVLLKSVGFKDEDEAVKEQKP